MLCFYSTLQNVVKLGLHCTTSDTVLNEWLSFSRVWFLLLRASVAQPEWGLRAATGSSRWTHHRRDRQVWYLSWVVWSWRWDKHCFVRGQEACVRGAAPSFSRHCNPGVSKLFSSRAAFVVCTASDDQCTKTIKWMLLKRDLTVPYTLM